MIFGSVLILSSILALFLPKLAILFTVFFFAGTGLFIYSWVMHQPIKVEALADFEDMGWRIGRLKIKKAEIIDILHRYEKKLSKADEQTLNSSIFC